MISCDVFEGHLASAVRAADAPSTRQELIGWTGHIGSCCSGGCCSLSIHSQFTEEEKVNLLEPLLSGDVEGEQPQLSNFIALQARI